MNSAYLSFSADVNPLSIEALLGTCADLSSKGVAQLHLLLSTPGGSVDCGINAYNVLRGLPIEIVTYNAGSVNSIGNVLFLAGDKRYASPGSTFMFHGVGVDQQQPKRWEEKDLLEVLDRIQADTRKISRILVDRTTLDQDRADAMFRQAVTKDAGFAKEVGIVHDVCEIKIPRGAAVRQFVFKR